MSSDITPFKGRIQRASTQARVLRRFVKLNHVAEIRERAVAGLDAFEFTVFVDGSLLESQLFHGRRVNEYGPAVEQRGSQFLENGWREVNAESA